MITSAKRPPFDRRGEEAMKQLRQLLPLGTTVFTILRTVSRSGMSREIDVVVWDHAFGTPVMVSWQVAMALDRPLGKTSNTVVVKGTGMDMEFYLVSQVAVLLHGEHHALTHRRL